MKGGGSPTEASIVLPSGPPGCPNSKGGERALSRGQPSVGGLYLQQTGPSKSGYIGPAAPELAPATDGIEFDTAAATAPVTATACHLAADIATTTGESAQVGAAFVRT